MKVLHAAKFYPPVPGGMESLVQSLCNGPRRAGTFVLSPPTSRDGRSKSALARYGKARWCDRVAGVRAAMMGVERAVPR
jgi:hypothetical protein